MGDKRLCYIKDDRELTSQLKRIICDALKEYDADFQLMTGPSNEVNAFTSANHGRHVRINIKVMF